MKFRLLLLILFVTLVCGCNHYHFQRTPHDDNRDTCNSIENFVPSTLSHYDMFTCGVEDYDRIPITPPEYYTDTCISLEDYAISFDKSYRLLTPYHIFKSYYQCITTSFDTAIPLVDHNNHHKGFLFYKEDSNYLTVSFFHVNVVTRFFPKDHIFLYNYFSERNIIAAMQSKGRMINDIKSTVDSYRNKRLHTSPKVVCLLTRKGEEESIKRIGNSCDTFFFNVTPLEWPQDTLFCTNCFRMNDMKKILSFLYTYEEWGEIIDSCYTNAKKKMSDPSVNQAN